MKAGKFARIVVRAVGMLAAMGLYVVEGDGVESRIFSRFSCMDRAVPVAP